jgi:hypothetical protein
MPSFSSNLRAEVQALSFPARRRARYRLHALANDALTRLGKPHRFEETFAEQWRRILANSREQLAALPAAGAPRVLFGSMFGAGWVTRPIEATLAMALRLRGATPYVLACDESLPACEWNAFGNFEPPPGEFGPGRWRHGSLHQCRTCMVKLEESHSLPGLERLSLQGYTRPEDLPAAVARAEGATLANLREQEYRGISVGEHAYSSLLRATMRGIPLDDERTRWLAKRYLASSMVLVDAGERLFQELRPDSFVAADGVYLLAGTLCELAHKRGIHVVVHGPPYRKGTVWLSHHECYHRALINDKNDHWKSLEMTPERVRVADEYLGSKHFVARDYTTYHVDSIKDDEAIRKELGLDERPIVSVFTNVLWDAQLYYRFAIFSNMIEWLFETIRHYARRPDVQLVIRMHPAEAPGRLPTNQPLLPELERAFPELPPNVKVVRPESKVSSYTLGAMSRVALVYGARVGVELVILGTPVIVAGEAFMRGKGFTRDPRTREEYFELLDRCGTLERVPEAERALARKWYYYYFFRLMMPLPFFEADRHGSITDSRLTFDSLGDLLPGKSAVLDRICTGILDGETRFEWDEFEGRP